MGGPNCIRFATFQLKKAANMPKWVDLPRWLERLQKTWFYHYMRNLQQLSQNTIMPSFWPGGRAMRRDILMATATCKSKHSGSTCSTVAVPARPRSLIFEPLELLATDEAGCSAAAIRESASEASALGIPIS